MAEHCLSQYVRLNRVRALSRLQHPELHLQTRMPADMHLQGGGVGMEGEIDSRHPFVNP